MKGLMKLKRGVQKDESRVPNMPAFLNANNLQPYVGKDLMGVLSKVDFISRILYISNLKASIKLNTV